MRIALRAFLFVNRYQGRDHSHHSVTNTVDSNRVQEIAETSSWNALWDINAYVCVYVLRLRMCLYMHVYRQ